MLATPDKPLYPPYHTPPLPISLLVHQQQQQRCEWPERQRVYSPVPLLVFSRVGLKQGSLGAHHRFYLWIGQEGGGVVKGKD